MDHVGFAVRSLEASRQACADLGLQMTRVETIANEGVRVGIVPVGVVPVGIARIEFLEALGEGTAVERFLSRRGEGVHHVALSVHNIDELFARLTEERVRLASPAVRVGAGGHRYFFVHPESTGGTLVELVENGKEVSL
nr:VOC family protein [Granulicella sibirica]